MIHENMMLAVRPLSDKIIRNNNSTVRVVEKSLLALPKFWTFVAA
jgi:hypothetical protein